MASALLPFADRSPSCLVKSLISLVMSEANMPNKSFRFSPSHSSTVTFVRQCIVCLHARCRLGGETTGGHQEAVLDLVLMCGADELVYDGLGDFLVHLLALHDRLPRQAFRSAFGSADVHVDDMVVRSAPASDDLVP